MTREHHIQLNGTHHHVRDFKRREDVITILKKRFTTYGYEQIAIPTYESYDLYTSIQGTVHRHDMVKIIDQSGEVLVLRPDVTIPIMKKIVDDTTGNHVESRYFYSLNVFRHSFGSGYDKERTQAGVEHFGDDSIEADAEMIALAIHSLRDLSFEDFKIELGHAGFFKELIDELDLTMTELKELKRLIQTKNVIEIDPFLSQLHVSPSLKQAIQTIPLLYGNPSDVLKRALGIAQNKRMNNKIKRLLNIYDLLKAYGFEKYIAVDLGLINHMDYYSGIIFQGFVNAIGKPVLMGGRYDQLARQLQTLIPAIGFAMDVDRLLSGISPKDYNEQPIDVIITYANDQRQIGLTLAYTLREQNYRVLTLPVERELYHKQSCYIVHVLTDGIKIIKNDESFVVQTIDDVQKLFS